MTANHNHHENSTGKCGTCGVAMSENIQDYAAQKAFDAIAELPSGFIRGGGVALIRGLVRRSILEAMRDQRYACVDAVAALEGSSLIATLAAIHNADVIAKS